MKIQSPLSPVMLALTASLLFLHSPNATADADKKLAPAVALPSKKPFFHNWRLIAQSDMIVQGKLRAPVAKLGAAIKNKKREYIPLSLDVTRVLKGKPAEKTLAIQIFSDASSYDVSPQTVLSLHGKEVTAFIVAPDDGPNLGTLYFAGYTPDGLAASSQWLTKHVTDEINNQKRITANFARPGSFAPTPMDDKVKKLMAGMLSEKTQFQSFADLEALGDSAVPATIRWMDDRRPLVIPQISLRNKSLQAFEEFRHYSPRQVVDALDAILNQVTGESYGSLGGFLTSDAHRKQTVDAWRTYLYYGRPKNEG